MRRGMWKWPLHVGAIVIIGLAFWPMAKWYMDYSPLWGVDFFYTASLSKLLADSHAWWPASGWSYAWFSGWPLVSAYPILHNYVIWPLIGWVGLIGAVKWWMVVSLGLYLVGMYACFWALSRNFVLATVLAIAGAYSVGVYGTLMWGGSLPNHATQMFFPWAVWCVINFMRWGSWRWVYMGALVMGLSIWGHPQIGIAYIFPTVGLLFAMWWGRRKVFERFKAGVVMMGLAIVIGLPLLYKSAGGALQVLVVTGAHQAQVANSTVRLPSTLDVDIDHFHKAQPKRIIDDTNGTVFVMLAVAAGVWVISWAIKFKHKGWGDVVVMGLVAAYYVGYITIYAYGVSIYHGGWYRLFWATPFWMGLLVTAVWGAGQEAVTTRLRQSGIAVVIVLSAVVGIVGAQNLIGYSVGVRDKIILRSTESSAYPDVLSMRRNDTGFARLKKELVPSWLDGDDTRYRLYTADQTVNIWWNAMYKMPLARGYYDPPVDAAGRGYFFWMDAALSRDQKKPELDQLVGSFGYPEEVARKNTLFLLDWYGVKYLEAGHAGPTTFAPLPAWLWTNDYMKNSQELDFNKEKFRKGNETLKYWEMKDEFVSPILETSSAPVVGVVASDGGYETIIRSLADGGMGLAKIIPLKLGRNLDKLGKTESEALDGVILYDYDYWDKNKGFAWVDQFLRLGKKVFVETGVENKETSSSLLPEFFPVKGVTRRSLGTEWDLHATQGPLFEGVDVGQFAPPIFDGDPWSFSYTEVALRPGGEEYLANHGRIILAGTAHNSGRVIWSGMNLPYHVIRFHNAAEITLWQHIIDQIAGSASVKSETVGKFISSGKDEITVNGNKGVIFKQQAYPGWSAHVGWQGLPIFKAGPTYPGFMYIPAKGKSGKIQIEYRGDMLTWALVAISFGVVILILDYCLLRGLVVCRMLGGLGRVVGHVADRWWKKDNEYE